MRLKAKNRFWVFLNLSCHHLHGGSRIKSFMGSRAPDRAVVDLASEPSIKVIVALVRDTELPFNTESSLPH